MHICVVSPDYPTSNTIDFVFVDQLCRALAVKGVKVTVVAPQSLTKCLLQHVPVANMCQRIYVSEDKFFTLIRPKYISVGNVKGILKNHNRNAFRKAVRRGVRLIQGKIDVIYGHFWHSVLAVLPEAKALRLPLIAVSGEELVNKNRLGITDSQISNLLESVIGTIHVSTNNRNECITTGLTLIDKSIVIPNAIDNTLFYRRDRQACRKKLGLEDGDFLVAFIGQFTSRKGTIRLNEALKSLGDKSIKAFFGGKGPDIPDYEGIIKCGTVMHDMLPEYLSAADVFVLPTLNEGCCNAIIEAMACGLPVISSDLPFNYDVLDNTNSLLVNPNDIDEIARAIKQIREDRELHDKLAKGALVKAESLTLDQRANKIISFIENKLYDSK